MTAGPTLTSASTQVSQMTEAGGRVWFARPNTYQPEGGVMAHILPGTTATTTTNNDGTLALKVADPNTHVSTYFTASKT